MSFSPIVSGVACLAIMGEISDVANIPGGFHCSAVVSPIYFSILHYADTGPELSIPEILIMSETE